MMPPALFYAMLSSPHVGVKRGRNDHGSKRLNGKFDPPSVILVECLRRQDADILRLIHVVL